MLHGKSQIQSGIDQIISERPKFHGSDGDVSWGINTNILNWLGANIHPGMSTLETGAGYSTVIFALCGSSHTAISPAPQEHKRIVEWCQQHDIATEGITFIDGCSELVLPGLKADPLDIVLIDGRHAFPSPFIDWYYTASRLKVGGRVIIDDVHLRACKTLNEFLHAEKGRWKRQEQFTTSAIYEKISEDIHARNWSYQPWCAKKHYSLKAKSIMFKNKIKKQVLDVLGLR